MLSNVGCRSQVARFETETRNPSMEHICGLADALNVSPRYLLYGEEAPAPENTPFAEPQLARKGLQIQGKPKGRTMIQIYPTTASAIRRIAANNGLTGAEVVDQFVRYGLANLEL